jgi:hypothetical protein
MVEQTPKKPRMLVIFGEAIGIWRVGVHTNGTLGRTAKELRTERR